MPAIARSLVGATLALFAAGCASVDLGDYRTVAVTAEKGRSNWHGLPLATGQIIVNEHPGATSLFLSLTAERYAPFIHAGIVVMEDKPYVYEAFGTFVPLPWRSPNASTGGGVRRVSLESFLARGGIVAIYEPDARVDRVKVAEFARARFQERTPFDGRYDARDASRLYCVEFVARALEAAGAAPVVVAPTTRNASVRLALEWLGIDTPGFLLAGDLADATRRVALLSRNDTSVEIERYFALKRELHQRFTPDQKLGSLMYWRHQALHLRPQIVAFFDAGVASAVDPAALADRMFGPLNADARLATLR